MTASADGPDARVESIEELKALLGRLLDEAYANGVEVEGGWSVRTANRETPDWTVEIAHLRGTDEER
ncbi:hypothetical protein [Halomarina pelagica]|uniref:hypothetical protein n=1 Tax=Halomarina pelagica TaxID=2961599 RepID=UPI0020C2305C|nr:hypothetical protein [Halomarina sp. BND7]